MGSDMRVLCGAFLVAAVVLLAASGAWATVNIETVPVGNPGNAADTHGDGYGAVDYNFNIGTYEVTAGQYRDFLNAVAKTDTYGLYNSSMDSSAYGCQITQNGTSGNFTYDFSGRPSGTEADWVDRPVNYVSFWDACRFANWLHNDQQTGAQGAGTTERGAYTLDGYNGDDGRTIQRNPGALWAVTSEDEWYKAAYHKNDGDTGNYFDYPTASNTAPGYVNNSGDLSTTGNPFVEGGVDPGNYATYDGDGGTNGIGSPYYRTVVGEWENSESPYDTFDQGGNVLEWNEAIIGGSGRGLRGGSFFFFGVDGPLRAADRIAGDPPLEFYLHGFRVSEVPEPATMGLLALGGLGMLIRRRSARR